MLIIPPVNSNNSHSHIRSRPDASSLRNRQSVVPSVCRSSIRLILLNRRRLGTTLSNLERRVFPPFRAFAQRQRLPRRQSLLCLDSDRPRLDMDLDLFRDTFPRAILLTRLIVKAHRQPPSLSPRQDTVSAPVRAILRTATATTLPHPRRGRRRAASRPRLRSTATTR